MLRQGRVGWRLCLSRCLTLLLRLARYHWRGCLSYCSTAWPGLCNRLWCRRGLDSLSSGNCDTARDNRGGRDAEACTRDEIAARDNRTRMFLRSFRTNWLVAR